MCEVKVLVISKTSSWPRVAVIHKYLIKQPPPQKNPTMNQNRGITRHVALMRL